MAQSAWVAMTRETVQRQSANRTGPCVDAGVTELSEMTIGRTDDPENPILATAGQPGRVIVWGWIAEPIWASGHGPRQQAGHMLAVDPPVKILVDALEPKGPSTHTLSRNPLVRLPFTNGRLRMDHRRTANPSLFPFKTLFQNRSQRQAQSERSLSVRFRTNRAVTPLPGVPG